MVFIPVGLATETLLNELDKETLMIRMYLTFLILTALFWFGIAAFRKTTGKEKWRLTKIAVYSILCSVLAVTVLTSIVILF